MGLGWHGDCISDHAGNVARQGDQTMPSTTQFASTIIDIAELLQSRNFGDTEVGPRAVWLLLQRIIEEARAIQALERLES